MNFRPPVKKSGISLDITPLVDTVFNLMIFFALSMNFIASPGFKVKLPSASQAVPIQERKNLEVLISASGKIYIENREVRDIENEMKKMFKTGKYRAVVIKADRNTPHGKVVRVLDAARSAGFRVLAIATRQRKR